MPDLSLSRSSENLRDVAIPEGTIIPFAGDSAPTGFMLCDGSELDRDLFPELFLNIGTAWGTSSGTKFNLPDLRGRTLRGVDAGAGVDPDAGSRTANAAGGNTGDNVGTVQDNATKLPNTAFGASGGAHGHRLRYSIQAVAGPYINGASVGGGGGATNISDSSVETTNSSHSHSITGGDLETRMKNANCQYIIKY